MQTVQAILNLAPKESGYCGQCWRTRFSVPRIQINTDSGGAPRISLPRTLVSADSAGGPDSRSRGSRSTRTVVELPNLAPADSGYCRQRWRSSILLPRTLVNTDSGGAPEPRSRGLWLLQTVLEDPNLAPADSG